MKKFLGSLALAFVVAASALGSTGSRVCCEDVCDEPDSCCVQDEAACPLTGEQASPLTCN